MISQVAQSRPLQAFLGVAFLVLGAFSPVFFAAAFVLFWRAITSSQSSQGFRYGVLALFVSLFLLAAGYGIGKDLAHRDNAIGASARGSVA